MNVTQGSQGKAQRWVSMGEGEIQGRSIDVGGSVFRSVRRGRRVEGQGQQGVLRVREIKGGQ